MQILKHFRLWRCHEKLRKIAVKIVVTQKMYICNGICSDETNGETPMANLAIKIGTESLNAAFLTWKIVEFPITTIPNAIAVPNLDSKKRIGNQCLS